MSDLGHTATGTVTSLADWRERAVGVHGRTRISAGDPEVEHQLDDEIERSLARSDKSTAELRQHLEQLEASADEVSAALERAAQRGYLDDDRSCAWLVEHRYLPKGMGRQRIRQELLHRGYDAATIEGCRRQSECGA